MKNIVAAHRARRAIGGAFFVALSLIAAACSPSPEAPAAATAAPAGDWVDPTGRFSLSFAARGWRQATSPRNPADLLNIIGPSHSEARPFLCGVLEPSSGGLLGGSQADINAAMRRRTVADDVPPEWSRAEGFQFAHATVDGVAVIDFSFSRQSMYQRWRVFRLPAAMGTTQYTMTCGAALPATAEERAEIEAIMTSLHFASEP